MNQKSLDKKKTKELDWEKEFQKLFLDDPYEKGIIYASGDNVKYFIQSILSTQRQEILEEILGLVDSLRLKEKLPEQGYELEGWERTKKYNLALDRVKAEIKSLKQNEK